MQMKNLTIEVPLSATQHGSNRIFCTRGPPWKDALSVVTFFATSYIAHAATVKSTPGEGTISMVFNTFMALCFPMFGLLRALNAIARGARFGGSELRNACRAGALCMVVRNPEWRPKPGDTLAAVIEEKSQSDEENNVTADVIDAKMVNYFPTYAREDSSAWAYFDTIGSRAYVDPDLTRIHGTYYLSKGYAFAIVPRNACLLEIDRTDPTPLAPHMENPSPTPAETSQPPGNEPILNHGSRSTGNLDDNTANLQSTSMISGDPTNQSVNSIHNSEPSSGNVSIPTLGKGSTPDANSDISSSYSVAKAIASLIQILGALSILILRKRYTLERWGYASFQLTVVPYLVMTLVNFTSNALTADYACLYMVESEFMREARNSGSRFEGTVAALEEYVGPLSPDVSAKDIASWTGLKQKHVRRIASILSGSWLSKMLFDPYRAIPKASKREVPTISHTQLTRGELVETNHPQSEGTTAGDQQEHQPATYTLRRSSNIDLEQDSPGPVGNENSSAPAANERIESEVPGIHQNHPQQLAADISHQRNPVDSPTESDVILTSSSGQRYRIHGFRSTSLLDPELFHGAGKRRETLRQIFENASHAPSALDRQKIFMARFLRVFYDDFFQSLDPVRLRLIASVEQVKNNRTGDESWRRLIVMLYKSLSNNGLTASPDDSTEHGHRKIAIYIPNCSPFVREGKHKDKQPKGRGHAGVMMVLEILLGCVILGLLFVMLGWLSDWFSRGQSSRTERAILLLWVAEGAFGLLLPLLGLKELIMVFLLLPLYATALQQRALALVVPAAQYLHLLAFIPIGIFVAPIWGFVIVGRQIVEWGICVTLY